MKPRPPASPPCSAHEVDRDYMWAPKEKRAGAAATKPARVKRPVAKSKKR
jgi:hypothetical protein